MDSRREPSHYSTMTDRTVVQTDRRCGGQDMKLVGLVSAAHFISHFYQLVLPPIFPLLTAAFGVGYVELGVVITLSSATSGIAQPLAGILVDRFGSARALIGGMALYSTMIAALGLAPDIWWMMPAALLAGFGNCVFHPADYAIMTARIDPGRLGRAFGAHTFAGNLGWVAAPIAVLALTGAFGWRAALVSLGGAGLAFTAYLASQRAVLSAPAAATLRTAEPQRVSGTAKLYLSPPIQLCFAYFTLLAVAQIGLQTFLPSTVVAAFGVSIESANLMLTGFLLASSLGILAGGLFADRLGRPGLQIGAGLSISAALSLALALPAMTLVTLTICVSLAGFAFGATIPARDLVVRMAAPRDATGKVFGFVYSGLDLGGALAPPLFGLLLDHHLPRLVFVVVAAALLIAVATAVMAGGPVAREAERPA
jgi:FSR family fosmidomycin resistance protein-like MFS transporter